MRCASSLLCNRCAQAQPFCCRRQSRARNSSQVLSTVLQARPLRRSLARHAVEGTRHSSPGNQQQSDSETRRCLDKAVGLIKTADLLAPFDRSAYSAPLVIW